MADDSHTLRHIDWREVFPFTHLFRAFRVAVHPSKLVLGLVFLLLLYTGGRFLDAIWPRRAMAVSGEISQYEDFRWQNDSVRTLRDQPSPRSFGWWREQQREENAEAYAQLLLQAHLAPDEKSARQAAEEGQFSSELQAHVIQDRNDELARIGDARWKASEEARKNPDPVAAHREAVDADAAYDRGAQDARRKATDHLRALRTLRPHGIFITFFEYQARQLNDVVNGVLSGNWIGGFHPAAGPEPRVAQPGVIRAIANFTVVAPGWLLSNHPVYFVLFVAWKLVLWALFGGAIARIAAVHVARDEKISVRQALSFSFSKVLSFVFAPVIPLLIVVALGAVVAIGGLLFYIPVIGPIVGGLGMVLALIAGFVMTLVSLGTVGGFNLMYPTVAVEGSDSFDAISRSFSYVFARPWRMLWYTLVSVVYGAICFLFVRYFIYAMLAITHFFVWWFLGGQAGRYFPEIWPSPSPANLTYDINFSALHWAEAMGAFLIAFWVYLVITMLGAYLVSFYLSANTIIYYLMRREVDATEMDDVYVEETEDDFGERAAVTGDTIATAGDPVAKTVTVVTEVVAAPVTPPIAPPPPDETPRPADET